MPQLVNMMIKYILSILILLICTVTSAQEFSLSDRNIKDFNSQIKRLEIESKAIPLTSIPQATAHYFEIYTKSPKLFIQSLAEAENFDQLANAYPNLITDKDLLIIKNIHFDYQKEKKMEISSFEIGNSPMHQVRFTYSDSLNNDQIAYVFNTYTDKDITRINGFYLKSKFISIAIPDHYTKWINYNDILIEPEKPIFLTPARNNFYGLTVHEKVIDTLISYFNIKSNKPLLSLLTEDLNLFSDKLNRWRSRKHAVADSLYKKDEKFKNLLDNALNYAEKNSVTNEDLEDMAYSTIPKFRALNLIRQSQTIGTCSFDDRPLEQMKRIATLAAETSNWSLFLKSSLNVLNDNVSRVAQSNIASNNRKSYVEELVKLNLDLNKVLIGSNFRINDSINTHYYSDGGKIAKAYSSLSEKHQGFFEKTITEILKDPYIDTFNKLHFYNTYLNFKYLAKDSLKIKTTSQNISRLVTYLPHEIKSRIDNPNKFLNDLLYRENSLLERFKIVSSAIGSIYSYNYGGMCWKADIIEKDTDNKIVYSLTMPINEEITPLKNFTDKIDSLKNAVLRSNFLKQKLNSDLKNELHLEFTDTKSFTDHNNYTTKDIPKELAMKLDFTNAISLLIKDSRNKYSRYVLLNNNNILAIKSFMDIDKKDIYSLYNKNGLQLY